MAMQDYANFDLLIEPSATGYRARVLDSPAGQATVDFTAPFSTEEQAAITAANWSTTAARAFKFGGDSHPIPPPLATKTVGERLYAAVFQGDVRACLLISLAKQARLRIRLRLNNVPDLAALPWEYLRGPSPYDFFALSAQTPIVRYLELLQGATPLRVELPLRILVLLSAPTDVPWLNVEQEWGRLKTTLAPLEQQRLILLERAKANLDSLQQRLQQQTAPVHILHFIGHGAFDEANETGGLLFEDSDGRRQFVSADKLGTLLFDHPSLRLAFLNSCEGARSGPANLFAGLAQALAQKGLPAVIAMQYTVSDNAAITLAASFYQALAQVYPVDAALAEARKTLYTKTNQTEWGTPVLFMRAPDGLLFQTQAEEEMTEKKQSGSQHINTGGGPYIGGSVNTGGGDFVGRDKKKVVYGDEVHGDKVGGDKIVATIGAGAKNVAVGKDIRQTVTETYGPPTPDDKPLIQAQFQRILIVLNAVAVDPRTAGKAEANLEMLQDELTKTAADETPEASAIVRAGDSLLTNVPQLKPALAELFGMPAVGKVLSKAGDAVVAWGKTRFG